MSITFKAFLPFDDLIDDVSDERKDREGIWVYLKSPSKAAEVHCAPQTLHEDTISLLVAQLKDVRKESDRLERKGAALCMECHEERALLDLHDDTGECIDCHNKAIDARIASTVGR